MKYGLNEETIQKIKEVFSKHPQVVKAVIYGSRAKGNYKRGSDIDLTLMGDIDLSIKFQIENELDDLLLPYTIDLTIYNKLSDPKFINHIERIGEMFYERIKT